MFRKTKEASENGNDMFRNGTAHEAVEIVTMPKLAKILREIGEKVRDGFYKGYVAEAIVQLIQSKGDLMTLADLVEHQSTPVQHISITYNMKNIPLVRVWECPSNGQGIIALMAIRILEQMQKQNKIPSLDKLEHNSADIFMLSLKLFV
jgi:gamma-glutamyltranspeptidase/glutathione hydrolase